MHLLNSTIRRRRASDRLLLATRRRYVKKLTLVSFAALRLLGVSKKLVHEIIW
jgi:hypothetical protein